MFICLFFSRNNVMEMRLHGLNIVPRRLPFGDFPLCLQSLQVCTLNTTGKATYICAPRAWGEGFWGGLRRLGQAAELFPRPGRAGGVSPHQNARAESFDSISHSLDSCLLHVYVSTHNLPFPLVILFRAGVQGGPQSFRKRAISRVFFFFSGMPYGAPLLRIE